MFYIPKTIQGQGGVVLRDILLIMVMLITYLLIIAHFVVRKVGANKMANLTPKQINAITDIIDGANPLFFSNLSKLLDTPYPETKEAKERFMKCILKSWEERFK